MIEYDGTDAINLIKRKYPLIPKRTIARVLHANDLYLNKIGVLDFKPTLDMWLAYIKIKK